MNRLFAVRKVAAVLFSLALGAYALTNLVYAYPALETTVLALAKAAEAAESEFFYLMPLSKTVEGYTTFDAGLPSSNENEMMDALLAYLAEEDVSTLDLRDAVADSGIANQDLFYDTDEHWTTQTAFWAFCETVTYLESEYDLVLNPDGVYTVSENYNQTVYANSYLGDMGRALGSGYSGIDDFMLIYPKFSTNFQIITTDGQNEYVSISGGRFEGALIDVSLFNTDSDIMEADEDKYFAYLWGNYAFASVTNLENPDGLKVLFIKDSFATPVAAFMASACGKVDLIDPAYYDGDIEIYIAESDYDLVIVCVSGGNLTEDYFA